MHLNNTILAILALTISSYSYSYNQFYEETLFDLDNKLDDNKGWYIGSMLGSAKFNYDGGSDDTFASGGYWGINFNEVIGLESSLFSSADDSNGVKSTFLAFTITPKINIQFHRRFSLYLKGGIALSLQTSELNDSNDTSWSGTIPTYGLGGEFRIIEGLELRLSYDKLKGDLANDDIADSYADVEIDLDLVTVGIQYQF